MAPCREQQRRRQRQRHRHHRRLLWSQASRTCRLPERLLSCSSSVPIHASPVLPLRRTRVVLDRRRLLQGGAEIILVCRHPVPPRRARESFRLLLRGALPLEVSFRSTRALFSRVWIVPTLHRDRSGRPACCLHRQGIGTARLLTRGTAGNTGQLPRARNVSATGTGHGAECSASAQKFAVSSKWTACFLRVAHRGKLSRVPACPQSHRNGHQQEIWSRYTAVTGSR